MLSFSRGVLPPAFAAAAMHVTAPRTLRPLTRYDARPLRGLPDDTQVLEDAPPTTPQRIASDTRRRWRKVRIHCCGTRTCLRVTSIVATVLAVVLVTTFAFSNPYLFFDISTQLSNAFFRSPLWSSDTGGNWLYRIFFSVKYGSSCPPPAAAFQYDRFNSSTFWTSGQANPNEWSIEEIGRRTIPDYVIEYAPLIHLFSQEEFWPGDIAEHLLHVKPHVDYTPIGDCTTTYNLHNLHELNKYGRYVYLKSIDNVEDRPKWLSGEKNIPVPSEGNDNDDENNNVPAEVFNEESEEYSEGDDFDAMLADANLQAAIGRATGMPEDQHRHLRRQVVHEQANDQPGGRSKAPVVLVVVPKSDGIVDAFWFFFYSYNLGNKVFNIRFGNHVGDWEHTLVRFKHGQPHEVFFSEHFFGEAFSYAAVEKIGKRPVGYSGVGTHAMYGTSGIHRYILPFGLLHDQTDRGPLWDPVENLQAYTYDSRRDILRSSTRTPQAPISWFYFLGHWGDKAYPMSDSRQYRFAGEYHYVNGPLGPRYKNLRRKWICQGKVRCNIKQLQDGSEPDVGQAGPEEQGGDGRGEEMNMEDQEQFLADEGYIHGVPVDVGILPPVDEAAELSDQLVV